MIKLSNIHKYYSTGEGRLHVLQGINLHIKPGEFVSIMGSSGSGKSTLLNVLGILDDYDSGDYYLNQTYIKHLPEKQAAIYRNQFIGFIFQSYNLLPFKNSVDNVALPLFYQKIKRKDRNALALEMLAKFDLDDRANHFPHQLSGGQQQRVAIARALVTQPKLILADEPTGNLDSKNSEEIMNVFQEVHKSGMTLIVVTHEKDIADATDRTLYLRDGQIMINK